MKTSASKETRLFLRLALVFVGLTAILAAAFGNWEEDSALLAWLVLP